VTVLCNAATYCYRDIRFLESQKFGFWGAPGGTAPKMGEDLSDTDMYHRANFHADRRKISVPGQNRPTYFRYRGLPWALYTVPCYTF